VDAGASGITVTLTVSDGKLSLAGTSGLTVSGNGTGTVTASGTTSNLNSALDGLVYNPNQDFFGTDSIQVHADDNGNTGSGGSQTADGAAGITVNPVDDGPVVDLNGPGSGTSNNPMFSEVLPTSPAVQLAPSGTISDVDSAQLVSLTVTLTNAQDGSSESLAADAGSTGLIVDADPSGHVLLIHGLGALADYQTVLRSVTYSDSAHPPTATPDRSITFVARDSGNVDSAPSTATVTVVPIDAPPVTDLNGTANAGIDNNAAFIEDQPAVAIAPSTDLTDADDTHLESATVTLTNHPDAGTELLSGSTAGTSGITIDAYNAGVLLIHGHATLADYQTVLRSVTYNNSSNTPDTTPRDVSVIVNDGQANSPEAFSHVSVTAHNDAPTLDLNSTDPSLNSTATFTEDQPAVTLAPNTAIGDVDNTNLLSATITLTNPLDTTAESLSVDTSATPAISAGGGYNSGTGVLTLSGSDTLAHYQQVLQTIKYDNTSQNANTTPRVVNFVVNDGSNDSNSPTSTVTIHVVNDPPVVDMNGGGSGIDSGPVAFTEDSSPTVVGSGPVNLGSSATVTDLDNATLSKVTLTLTSHPDGVNESLAVTIPGGNPITTGGYNATSGELLLTGNGATLAQFQTVIQSARYNNVSNTPDQTQRDVTIVANDGTANSTPAAHTLINVTATNDAPTATAKSFTGGNSAVGNTTFVLNDGSDGAPSTQDPTDTSVAADQRPHKTLNSSVLTGSTDAEGNTITVASAGTSASGGTNGATEDGGTVTVQPDGDIVVEPKASTSCTDHSDSFTYKVQDNGSPSGTSTSTVSFDIAACVYYVNNNDGDGNSGTSAAPYDTLAQAESASATTAGDVFVYKGDGSTTGYDNGLNLTANHKLVGQASGLVVGGDTLSSGDSAKRPTITHLNQDVVVLASGSGVQGVNIDPFGTGGGIFGGATVNGSTLSDVTIIDTGPVGGPQLAGTQPSLELNGTTGTFNISNLTVDNSAATGTTSGSEGVVLNSAGTVNFASGGKISITTKGAKGLDATSTNMGAGSVFNDITVTGSGTGGVKMSSTTGTTSLGDGSGTDLDLATSSGAAAALNIVNAGTVSVPGGGVANLSATGGPAADIQSTSSPASAGYDLDSVSSSSSSTDGVNLDTLGAAFFTATGGSIGGESGIGFDLNGGTGTVTYPGSFSNGSGPLTAEITGRTGGTATLSGQITDSSDNGGGISFTGNTGATAVVTNANNVVDGGNATAIDVENTTIGASGINFKTASSNGATNGIKLDTTGSTGGLNVASTGSGTCAAAANAGCTGGSVQNSSGAGVALSNVGGPVNLTRMSVNGGGDDGIQASNVGTSAGNGIALSNSFLGSNGNAAFESGLEYDNVLGISSITNVTSTGNFDNNADIQNTSGTGRFTVDSSTFSSNSATGGSDGLNMNPGGTAIVRALVQNSTFSANRDDGYQLKADGDSTVDLTFNNNTVHAAGNAGAVSAHAGLNFDGNTTSDVKMSMTGGTVDGADGSAIIVNPAGSTATFQGTLDNVTVGTAGVVHSGSLGGHAVWIEPAQQPASRFVVKNSHLNGVQGNGIQVLAGGNSGADTTDVTFTNNVIRTTGNEPFYIQSGANSGDTNDVCADIGGAGGDNGAPGNDFAGQAPGGLTDIFFNRRSIAAGVHLRLAGFDGNAANLTSYVQGRNVGNPTVFNNGQALESGPATCAQPASPTLP
jgi:hypothetical protein